MWVALQSGYPNLLTVDVGGTSTDVALIQNGEPRLRRETTVGDVTVRASSVDIRTVGAGGGSCLLYTFRAHETVLDLVCRLLLDKKNITIKQPILFNDFMTFTNFIYLTIFTIPTSARLFRTIL